MKKSLLEELKRIHSITYKNIEAFKKATEKISLTEDSLKIDDPKKADLVSNNVTEFFATLESIDSPVFQQQKGSMTFQKNVETVQIGLILLGYELPRFGVDGLFGPETASAIRKFKTDNNINDGNSTINESTLIAPIDITGISSKYGTKRKYETHPGVDLKATSGTEIKSPGDGKVIDAGFKNGGCGGTIQIDHGNGFKSRFCHCKDIRVNIGQEVKQGEVVGLSGGNKGDKGSGNSSGAHLHFELKKDGSLVDPLDYVDKELGSYDFKKSSSKINKEIITPEMVMVMVQKLKQRGVDEKELQMYIDAKATTGGGELFTDLDLNDETDKKIYEMICQKFIDSNQPNPLKINGKMMADAAQYAFQQTGNYVPPELALSQLVLEGGIKNGNIKSRPIRTRNPFNVGNTDSGSNITHSRVEDGIRAYYLLISKKYLGKNRNATTLINNFVNMRGGRYATNTNYENQLKKISSLVNRTSNQIIASVKGNDMSNFA